MDYHFQTVPAEHDCQGPVCQKCRAMRFCPQCYPKCYAAHIPMCQFISKFVAESKSPFESNPLFAKAIYFRDVYCSVRSPVAQNRCFTSFIQAMTDFIEESKFPLSSIAEYFDGRPGVAILSVAPMPLPASVQNCRLILRGQPKSRQVVFVLSPSSQFMQNEARKYNVPFSTPDDLKKNRDNLNDSGFYVVDQSAPTRTQSM